MSYEDTSAFARDSNATGEAEAAASVAEGDPGDLVGAEHPGGRVGGVSGFLHEVGGVHIVVGGVGVHLLAGVGVGSIGARRVPAIVLVVHEDVLFAVIGDEVAGRDLWNARVCRPLFHVFGEWLGELDHRELVIGQLAGENGDCGRGLTVGGMEIKCAERHPGLHVEPEEAAAAEIGAAVAGDGDKTAVADQDGLLCAVEDGIDSVRERHVAAIVVFSAGDGLLHQVVEALVFEKGFGGLVSIVLEERELIDGDEGLKVGWRRRAGGWEIGLGVGRGSRCGCGGRFRRLRGRRSV